MEKADGGHERLSNGCGHEHLDREQHVVRRAIDSERRRFGGGLQGSWEYRAGESRNVGLTTDGLYAGAGLFLYRRSAGAEPVFLHNHRRPGSLDANERCDDSHNNGGDRSGGRQLHTAGAVH
jgi:hypothetical protein